MNAKVAMNVKAGILLLMPQMLMLVAADNSVKAICPHKLELEVNLDLGNIGFGICFDTASTIDEDLAQTFSNRLVVKVKMLGMVKDLFDLAVRGKKVDFSRSSDVGLFIFNVEEAISELKTAAHLYNAKRMSGFFFKFKIDTGFGESHLLVGYYKNTGFQIQASVSVPIYTLMYGYFPVWANVTIEYKSVDPGKFRLEFRLTNGFSLPRLYTKFMFGFELTMPLTMVIPSGVDAHAFLHAEILDAGIGYDTATGFYRRLT